MITRKKSRRRLKVVFFIGYVFLFIGFIFLYPKILRSYFNNIEITSPLSGDAKRASNFRKEDKFYQDLVRDLNKAHINFISISVLEPSTYIVTIARNKEVIFSKNFNLSKQVSSLQLIQSRLTIEGEDFTRLDFRFSNPVIVLSKGF
ncbi:MAG: hypothetical protein M1289_01080 [Patescibacteria group bacterium]|nr:hypothetical protein [Patescibacteria group bacterium]